jgi:ABC-2 type transport system permease protein
MLPMFFVKLTWLAFKQQLTYRTALYAGLATNLFFGILRVAVMQGLYGNQSEVNHLSIRDAITYVGFSQALIAFLTLFGSIEFMQTVYSGQIGSDLLKPYNMYTYWMAKDLGKSLVNLFGRGILFMFLFGLIYPILFPQGWQQWGLFIVALGLCWLVSFSMRFLVNLSGFWTPDARGIARLAYALVGGLSGFIMPLRLMPDWFKQFCSLTPFPAIINTPAEIYLGIIQGREALPFIVQQLGWFVGLALVGQLVLRAGVRRLVIQGG